MFLIENLQQYCNPKSLQFTSNSLANRVVLRLAVVYALQQAHILMGVLQWALTPPKYGKISVLDEGAAYVGWQF